MQVTRNKTAFVLFGWHGTTLGIGETPNVRTTLGIESKNDKCYEWNTIKGFVIRRQQKHLLWYKMKQFNVILTFAINRAVSDIALAEAVSLLLAGCKYCTCLMILLWMGDDQVNTVHTLGKIISILSQISFPCCLFEEHQQTPFLYVYQHRQQKTFTVRFVADVNVQDFFRFLWSPFR